MAQLSVRHPSVDGEESATDDGDGDGDGDGDAVMVKVMGFRRRFGLISIRRAFISSVVIY